MPAENDLLSPITTRARTSGVIAQLLPQYPHLFPHFGGHSIELLRTVEVQPAHMPEPLVSQSLHLIVSFPSLFCAAYPKPSCVPI